MTMILSILGTMIPIVRWVLDIFKVKKETQDAFIAKIQAAKDDGKVPIEQADEFKRQDEELKNPPKDRDLGQ